MVMDKIGCSNMWHDIGRLRNNMSLRSDLYIATRMIEKVIQWEGWRRKVYEDMKGHKTIGIGFNLDRRGARKCLEEVGTNYNKIKWGYWYLSENQIRALYYTDFLGSIEGARRKVKSYDQLHTDAQCIIADMVFNMGLGTFFKFKRMIRAFNNMDYVTASIEMAKSTWGRKSHRAKEYIPAIRALSIDD